MNRMLFLICLRLAFLGGLEGRAWGMALSGRDASIHAYEGRDVVERELGAGVSEEAVSVAREGMTCHDYDTGKPRGFSGEVGCLERMQDGPNLYAYVKQNPWTSFDPDGLAETKPFYSQKGEKGIRKLEADPQHPERPLTRTTTEGQTQVQVNKYDVNPTLHYLTSYKGKSTGSSWENAEDYGVKQPVASARRNFETNNDPQKNLQAFSDAANKPLVKGLDDAIRTVYTQVTHAAIGAGMVAGFYVLRSSAAIGRGLGNPFKGKSAQQINDMFISKGYQPRGPSPVTGKGGYVNPKNGRPYHIDEANSFGEPAHVDVNRLRSYKGNLEKKYEMGGTPE